MVPDGFDEALEFYTTKRVPCGGWAGWLQSCYRVVERLYHFNCEWSMLLGMCVGMLEDGNAADKLAFRRVTKAAFHRADEKRFLYLFVALADALSGTSTQELQQAFRGNDGKRLRKPVPTNVLFWPNPSDAAARKTLTTNGILRDMKPTEVSLPATKYSDLNFYVNLLYGYYIVTRDEKALQCLYDEHCRQKANVPMCCRVPEFQNVLAYDPVAAFFAKQQQQQEAE